MRGGEKVLESLCRPVPRTPPLFTLVHVRGLGVAADRVAAHQDVDRSAAAARGRAVPPIPAAASRRSIELFDLDDFDLVISTSHCAAKSVVPTGRAVHVCYCHSPMRYAWDQFDAYFGAARVGRAAQRRVTARPGVAGAMGSRHRPSRAPLSRQLAVRCGADRAGTIIVRRRCSIRPWTRSSSRPGDASPEPYFLVVSALVPYKRLEIAIEAAARAGRAAQDRRQRTGSRPAAGDCRPRCRVPRRRDRRSTARPVSSAHARWCCRAKKTSASSRSRPWPAAGR